MSDLPAFTHVVFDHIFPRGTSTVPLAEAAAYVEANPSHSLIRVHNGNPEQYSYAKAWYAPNFGPMVSIGAGAYGDDIIWRHPDYDKLVYGRRHKAGIA